MFTTYPCQRLICLRVNLDTGKPASTGLACNAILQLAPVSNI